MGYVVCAVMFFILGRKYQELVDLMMARRIAKMIDQRNQLTKEREDYEKYIALDGKLGKMMTQEVD